MKLAASNLAWPTQEQSRAAAILRDLGATGVELAPGKSWERPLEASQAETLAVRRFWESQGFEIVAFQALIFGRPELQLFGPESIRRTFLDVLERLFVLAAGVGARVLVFGSPRNRQRGELSPELAHEAAVAFFQAAAEAAERHQVVLALEANPPVYGCDFATQLKEAAELVQAVNRPGFALHADTGGMLLSGEDAFAAGECPFAHLHLSEPNLVPLGTTAGANHAGIAHSLRAVGYLGWHSVEVRQPDREWEPALEQSLQMARRCYDYATGHVTGLGPTFSSTGGQR